MDKFYKLIPKNTSRFPNNSYIDEYLVKSYNDSKLKKFPLKLEKR